MKTYNSELPCDITSVDTVAMQLHCTTQGPGKTVKVDNNGISKGKYNNRKCFYKNAYKHLLETLLPVS